MSLMRQITKLIVHCSATPNERDVTVDEIRGWHKQRGWSDIGYHYVIYRNSQIMSGRPVRIVGAHCKGHNTGSIGICLIGNDEFTEKQFDSLKRLYSMLRDIFQGMTAHGHRDFTDKKTCPNFNVSEILKAHN